MRETAIEPFSTTKKRSPALWVSVIYFAEGFPYTIVNLMSIIFLKDLGASNELIGLTSFLYIPWVLKGLWGPVVDIYSTKRKWILFTELFCTLLFLLLALGALGPQAIVISIAVFALIAFVSATHDTAIDGFYLDALDKDQQAFFVGVRSTAYKLAWLAGNGGLVFLAGFLANERVINTNSDGTKIFGDFQFSIFGRAFSFQAPAFGWAVAFAIAAFLFLLIYLFQLWYLPHPAPFSRGRDRNGAEADFFEAFKSYFTQRRIGWIVFYVLLFRLGDAFMLKMAPPFLMDNSSKGGLTLSTAQMGILYGTVGVVFLLAGGVLGGFVIAKQGLKKWMWPTALLQNSAIALYWLLAKYRPGIEWVYVVNSFEQFSYGLGVSAYTVFLMRTVRPEFKASHYAITTAFMAAGILLPGVMSGYLQVRMGYEGYFLMSFLAAVPGLAAIYFLPLDEKK